MHRGDLDDHHKTLGFSNRADVNFNVSLSVKIYIFIHDACLTSNPRAYLCSKVHQPCLIFHIRHTWL